ncbi:MAG: hypothetical protein QM817_05560 [Archangium sp.]
MPITAQGFTFETPPGYLAEETTMALRPQDRGTGPSPTLIFHSRKVPADATLESLAAEVVSELSRGNPDGKVPRVADFAFADGEKGALVMHSADNVRQYLVIRLSHGTQATVMVNVPDVPELQATAPLFMQTFASLRVG